LERDTEPVSLRSACDMRRACRPTWLSPISPSSSARGTRAATLSTTSTSTAPERTSVSQISSACSPASGWLMQQVVDVHAELLGVAGVERVLRVDEGAGAALLLRSAMACSASVVLPELSGP
jgi:hypothetical protein